MSEKRPMFGNRHLDNVDRVFDHNAWDDVDWDEEQTEAARKAVEANSSVPPSSSVIEESIKGACSSWDSFYDIHSNRFFKDRNWLFTECPQLLQPSRGKASSTATASSSSTTTTTVTGLRVLEVGCGVGNSVFPILERVSNVHVFCCDFSSKAIDILREQGNFDPGKCTPFVCDISTDDFDNSFPFEEHSMDIVLVVFALSALEPEEQMKRAVNNIARCLKPGGLVFFRDYGQYDLAQLRFKRKSFLTSNFYARGDGTHCYFFSEDSVRHLFTNMAGMKEEYVKSDRRLQVNRGRKLKMFRVWIQAVFTLEGQQN